MGFPIRKCPDQSLFAAPRTLSQRTTSFIASQRQGIHRILLRHLIVLINNARRSAAAQPQTILSDEKGQDGIVTKRPEFACRTCPNLSAVRQKRSTQPDKPVMVCTRTLGMGNPRFEHVLSQR